MKRVVLSFMLLFTGWSMTSAQGTLSAGDVAIVALSSDDPDEFGLLLLADVLSGTEILFTDMGWEATSNAFLRTEDSMTWKANTNLPAGTLILFDNDPGIPAVNYGTITQGKLDDLSDNGDQLFVFQGTMANPNFLFAINFDGNGWEPNATNANNSALPTGLVNGVNALALPEYDNYIYTGDSIGSSAFLRGQICDSSLWARSDVRTNFDPSLNGRQAFLVDNGTPSIRTYSSTFNGDFGQITVNNQSAPSGFFVGGSNLISDIMISVNPPFEISINGGTYAASGNITPTLGTVNPTVVDVRMNPQTTGTFFDTVQISSIGAFTNQLLVRGEALLYPSVSFLTSGGLYNEGNADSIGVSILNKGSNTVIVNIISQTNTTAMEGQHFSYSGGPQAIFHPGTPDTLYVPIDFLDDSLSGPQFRTNRLAFMLNGADPGSIDTFDLIIRENDYRYSKIAEIKQLDLNHVAISMDSLFEVCGVVYGTNTLTSGYSFTLIDETAGISTFAMAGEPDFGYTIQEGDSVLVRGRLSQVDGLIQLDMLDTIRLIKALAIMKNPVLANTVGEKHENDLVRIDHVAFVNPPFVWLVTGSGSAFEVYNTVTLDTFEIYVRATSTLANTSAPTGTFDVVGLGGQLDGSLPYDQGYRLLPRYAADVIIDELDSFKLNSPIQNTTVTLQGSPNQTLKFDWFSSKPLNGGSIPTYSILFDLSTGDFLFPIMESSSGVDTSISFTYQELIDGFGSHLPNGGSVAAKWTVKAENGTQVEWSRTVHLITIERGVIDGLNFVTTLARIYPNPASTTLHVETNKPAEEMRLYDLNGRCLLEIHSPQRSQDIVVDKLPEGVYFLSIQQEGKLYRSRVVIGMRD